ncbi:MAG: NADH-quinone oxidoreductase subunit F, partial [Actinobacteria bacterium]|nr:NADH-quinone oxidoreductase subunit F [Actinomycetota bacterium]
MLEETRVVTARFSGDASLSSYGDYAALRKALTMTPEDVIGVVKESGLRGRGGAGFPT